MYSRILCCVSARFFNIPNPTKNRVAGVRAERSYRDYDAINGETTEFEWNIFPGFTTLQLCDKISNLLSSFGQTPESFTGRILFMSQPKGWIQGNMRIGPVLEVTTSFQNFTYGIEIRIWSVGQDNSQSWVRISHGTIKYVVDSNQNNTENSCRSTRRANSTNKHECGCSQVKGKSKTSTERTCWDDSNHTNTPKKMD